MQPLWQEVWRMCLHKPSSLLSPFLLGKGPGGWSKHPPARQRGAQSGCNLPRWFMGVCLHKPSPEGCNLSGKRYGGCASINYIFFTSPFLLGRGPGGWSEHPAPSQGSPEGLRPAGRGLGMSPQHEFSPACLTACLVPYNGASVAIARGIACSRPTPAANSPWPTKHRP